MPINSTIRLFLTFLFCVSVSACTTNQVVVANGGNGGAPQAAQKPVQKPPVLPVFARGAESGKKQLIETISSLNPDCSPADDPVVTVTKGATNGQVTVEKIETFPSFSKENVRYACNTQKAPATAIYYTSNAGYTGVDTAIVEIVAPTGGLVRRIYTVTVR